MYVFVIMGCHGPFLASPISPRRVSLLHSPAWRKFGTLETLWDSHGFTQGTIGDRFGSKNEHNSWKMMNK